MVFVLDQEEPMDSWPTADAVERALTALPAADGNEMRAALQAAGLPELIGVTAAAEILGVQTSNVTKMSGLPEPLYSPDHADSARRTSRNAGSLYPADAVRAFAAERRARLVA